MCYAIEEVKCTNVYTYVMSLQSWNRNKHFKEEEYILFSMFCVLLLSSSADVDECSDPELNECDHTCINTNGSYICSCPPGHYVDLDGHTCVGMCCMCVHMHDVESWGDTLYERMCMFSYIPSTCTMYPSKCVLAVVPV